MQANLDSDTGDENSPNPLMVQIRAALDRDGLTHYKMSLVGDDIQVVIDAVNQGIDAYLTACYCPARGDEYSFGDRSITASSDTAYWKAGDTLRLATTLDCRVSAESLPVLLRRLDDDGRETAWSLRSAILATLNIDVD